MLFLSELNDMRLSVYSKRQKVPGNLDYGSHYSSISPKGRMLNLQIPCGILRHILHALVSAVVGSVTSKFLRGEICSLLPTCIGLRVFQFLDIFLIEARQSRLLCIPDGGVLQRWINSYFKGSCPKTDANISTTSTCQSRFSARITTTLNTHRYMPIRFSLVCIIKFIQCHEQSKRHQFGKLNQYAEFKYQSN